MPPTGPVDNWVNDSVTTFYDEYIYPLLTPTQKVMLVPGSFGSDVNHYPNGTEICNRTCYDVMCAQDAEDFHTCTYLFFFWIGVSCSVWAVVLQVFRSLGIGHCVFGQMQ